MSLRVALVAMPWTRADQPSPALGLLAAVVRSRRPDDQVECKFPYLDVARRVGLDLYADISVTDNVLGDLVYAAHLYPERRDGLAPIFNKALRGSLREEQFDAALAAVLEVTGSNLRELAASLAGRHDVVGLTVTFTQLFSSLAIASELKRLDPAVRIVLGGAGVSYGTGPSVLAEYPFVDHVVQGDGESAFLELLAKLDERQAPATSSRELPVLGPSGSASAELFPDLDSLPVPDYDVYPELAQEGDAVDWSIPIEGSRGCWWDRVRRSGNPMDTCRFCIENGRAYREKSAGRVAREMAVQAERHGVLRFGFCDQVLRSKGLDTLLAEIERLELPFDFFYDVRANIDSHELLRLRKVGLTEAQIGVEGLSTAYLKRIGKGTTTIQNLQAMKTCFELGIYGHSNLVTHFPGATAEEVAETARNIRDFACAYQPLRQSTFCLDPNSTVSKLPDRFGVKNVRNADAYGAVLPPDVVERLQLPNLSFDRSDECVSWGEVEVALEDWMKLHARVRAMPSHAKYGVFFSLAPLYYLDRGRRLEIVDRRQDFRLITLDDAWRDLYLHCVEIRSVAEVTARFAGRASKSVPDMVEALVAERLMFVEAGRCLALAVAPTPEKAAERIGRAHEERALRVSA